MWKTRRPLRRAQWAGRLVVLVGCVALVCEARATYGADPVSRKVGASLLNAPAAPRGNVRVRAGDPWRDGRRVHVYVRVLSTAPATVDALRARGLEIVVVSTVFGGLIDGWADASDLPAIAELPEVTMIRPVAPPVTQSGAVVTAGDAALRADAVRAGGYTGAGVALGLISDGIKSAEMVRANGELPIVTVPADPRCKNFEGDEGTAMLEIVHDVAPGAGPLLFSSFGASGAVMADGVRCLADAGARVIVDDVTFADEPFFQDGPLALAAREVVQRGVSYHTSAGNRRREFLEERLAPFNHGVLGPIHDFDPAGGNDPGNNVTVRPNRNATCVIQWDEPFGGAATNLDLLAVQGSPTNVIAKSDNPQNGAQDPVELVSINNPTDTDQTVALIVLIRGGSTARTFRMMCLQSKEMERVSTEGVIYGQQAVTEVMAIGAINIGDAGLDSASAESSPGPATILFPAREVREKPDLASFDGVETAVGQAGLFGNPFFGTSAAAPHSGAVAALMLSKNPTLTPGQIQQIMKATAVDIEAPGFDRLSGAGRLDALAAVGAVSCVDGNALAAKTACSGEKAPKAATAAYKAARRLLVSSTGGSPKKARKRLNAASKQIGKAFTAIDKRSTRGKIGPGCAATLRAALTLLDNAVSCRLSG